MERGLGPSRRLSALVALQNHHFTYLSTGVGSEVLPRRMCMSLSTKPLPVARIRTYTINEGPMRAVM